MKPTEKQINRINRMIEYLGGERVLDYIKYFYPHITTVSDCNRIEAQKIITGLESYMLHNIIYRVYGRDFCPIEV
jgi:hypothetical protein